MLTADYSVATSLPNFVRHRFISRAGTGAALHITSIPFEAIIVHQNLPLLDIVLRKQFDWHLNV